MSDEQQRDGSNDGRGSQSGDSFPGQESGDRWTDGPEVVQQDKSHRSRGGE